MSPSHEQQDDLGTGERRPAGPVAGDAPPPGGVGPSSAPPAGATSSPAAGGTPSAGESSEQDDGASEVDQDFEALLKDAHRERDEYLDLARRTKADFENFRKRAAAQAQEALMRGKTEVAREVIDAVDNLERALLTAGAGDGEGLAAGVEMVLGGLRETLSRNGIEAVDPKGEKFDPTRHEALSTQPGDGTESGMVVEVMQKGYLLDEQLIRPARVVVSS
jgi:molecular chaperone GrpE